MASYSASISSQAWQVFSAASLDSNTSSLQILAYSRNVTSHSVLHLWSNSNTSNIPYPLLFLILIIFRLLSSFWFCYLLLSCYPLCSISIHPCLFVSIWPFYISMRLIIISFCFPHALMSCVDLTSCYFNCSSFVLQYLFPLRPLASEPLIFKPCISFNANQSDYYVSLHIFAFSYVLIALTLFPSTPTSSDLCLTSVQLWSPLTILKL